MKEQLTLKHLAPYLPYELQMIFESTGGRIITLIGITKQGKYGIVITSGQGGLWLSQGWKPILRPMSDLTKEIEHNGEKFVPEEVLMRLNQKDSSDYFSELILDAYEITSKLFEWHFDVFDLCSKGLAIDINTIDL